MAEVNRIVTTTIKKYLRETEQAIFRNRKFWAMLNSKGQMVMNQTGISFDWEVEYKEHELQAYGDGGTITFTPSDNFKNAELDYRGYVIPDVITVKQKLMNRGQEALVDLYGKMISRMSAAAKDRLGSEFYVDGNAAGNGNRFHGLESVFGTSGAVAGEKHAAPSDTYAGLSTALANYGGSWTGTWPTGTGDPHYDFWSPLLVDATNTGWNATTKTWPNTCLEALRYGIIKGKKNVNKDAQLDVIMLTDDRYTDFLNRLEDKTSLRVGPGREGSSGLWKLGFTDVQNFDGVDVTYEYGVSTGDSSAIGYGIPMGQIVMRSLQGNLLEDDSDMDLATQSERFLVRMFGNLQFRQIRNFLKFKNYT